MIPTSVDDFVSDPLFGLYLLCLTVVIGINLFFVILPINNLRKDYGFRVINSKGEVKKSIGSLKNLLRGPGGSKDNENEIRNYLFLEIGLTLLPLIVAISFRLSVEPKMVDEWGFLQIFIPSIFFSSWVFWNAYRANTFRKLISPYLSKNQKSVFKSLTKSPTTIKSMIGLTNFSRQNLKRLSEIEVPSYIEHEELDLEPIRIKSENEEEKEQFNTQGMMKNAGKIANRVTDSIKNAVTMGKELTADISKEVGHKIDRHIESKVSEWTTSGNLFLSLLHNTIIVFIPIIVIYLTPLF